MADLITRIIINARDNASATLGSIQENASKLATALAAYFTFDTFKDLVNSAAKFEKELDAVAAKGGYTSEEMKKLSEFATTVGVEFGRSGTEAAQGLTILAGAGLSASEAMKALPSVLAVSASESVSMEVAASGLIATVGIMGLKFSDTARVADVLTKAANLSDASVVGLNESFKGVGAQAAAAGYTVEQTAAMLDVLAKYALKGEVAGTGLGATLTALNDPTSKARVELSKLGINTSDVGTAMDGMKKAGVSSASAVLAFGETAKATVLALMKEGSPALKKFEEDLVSAGGASRQTAATMTANFEGAKGRMLAVFENLKTTLGTPILEPLTNGFNKFSTFVTGHVPLLVTMFETLATVMGIKVVQAIITMTASLSGSAVAFGATQLAAARAALSTDIFATASTRAATAVGLLSRAIPVFLAYEVGKTIGDWLSNFEGFRIGTLNVTQGVIGMGIAIKSVFNGDVLTAEGRAKYAAEIAFLAKSFDEQRAAASNATIEEQKNNATKIEGIKGVEAEKNAATAKEVERMATARQQAEQFSAIKIEALKNESAAIDARYKLANEAIAQNLKLDIEANHSIVQSTEEREKAETALIITASDKVMGVLTEAANNKKVLAKTVYDDAIAKSEGDTQKRAEYERNYANAKKEIDIEVLNTYRSTVDQMTAAAQAHRDKAIGYANEILDAEDRKAKGILQIERIGMDEKQLFASKKKEIELGISNYKKALADGDFQEAQKISKENEGLILSLASTEKTQSSEVSTLKRKYIEVIGQTETATKGLQTAEETQATALEENVKSQIEKMAGLKNEIDQIDTAISKEHLLKMNVDDSQIKTAAQEIANIPSDVYTTVHVRTVQEKSGGGQIQYFADGGSPQFNFQRREGGLGGFGGGDTVPAMLEPGEWIIKKESVKKYGDGFMAKLNAGQIDDVPHFATGGSVKSANWEAALHRDTDNLNSENKTFTDGLNSFLHDYQGKADSLSKKAKPQTQSAKEFVSAVWGFTNRAVTGRSNYADIEQTMRVLPVRWANVQYENGDISREERDLARAKATKAERDAPVYGVDNMAQREQIQAGRREIANVVESLEAAIKRGDTHKIEPFKQIQESDTSNKSKKPFFKAAGGHIQGKGTGTSDEIPAMLSNGEYVIKADAVDKIGVNTLDKINNGEKPKGFSNGGSVGESAPKQNQEITLNFKFQDGKSASANASPIDAKTIVDALREAANRGISL